MSLEKIITVQSLWDLLKTIIGLAIAAVTGFFIFGRMVKVNWRLAKNLGRKIFIFCPKGGSRTDGHDKDMRREIDVLKSSGYFELPKIPETDFHNIEEDSIENAEIVVMGYHREMSNFKEFVDLVKRHNKPLVIYTFELGYQLTVSHSEILKNYKWYVLSSMPLRLVSDLFAIMASYQYEH